MIHLDTHVAVWLFAGEHDRLPIPLQERLEADRIAMSPMMRLELGYLHEIGRIRHQSAEIVDELRRAVDLAVDETPFADVIAEAEGSRMSFTRDPFDRIIAGHALAAGADLATKDEKLRAHLDIAVWD